MSSTPRETLWYFAYGSNLDPGTFLGRRRMRPLDACCARLDGWRLVFDLRVGPGERGVANLLPDAGAWVHGVAWAIGRRQAAWLDLTEGVPQGVYRREAVRLARDDAGPLLAFTYVSEHRTPDRRPSQRYMNLLLRGARHHRLPDAWLTRLRAVPLAVDERQAQGELDLGR
ncbi:MAG: gamma-glutamylcyclotransferase family protein [Myxococcota bacterium]